MILQFSRKKREEDDSRGEEEKAIGVGSRKKEKRLLTGALFL